jgi:hypothetical protein
MNLQDIGNGYGYIYCTDVDGTTIKFTEGNDKYGVQNIKNRAVGSSPVVASRSATGTITITACAAVGAVTSITVCGIAILGASVPCTTTDPSEFATLIGQTINSFVSTPEFTAQAIGPTIYIFSPLISPETYNGCNIVVDVNTGTITSTTTLMTSGVTNNEAYDLTLGARYMLNADYNSSYVTNTLAAVPTALGNYIDITKQIISRGTNVGGTVTNVEILNDTITTTNRVSSSDSYIVDTQGAAATDYLVAINPDGFMQGDRVILRGNNPGHVVTIVSLPLAGLVSPVVQPNILLTGNIDFVSGSDSYIIELMFLYSKTYKQYIFTEVGRTTSGFALNVGTGLETYVTGTSPFEFRTTKLLAASNLLADYGFKAAQTGTELQWKNNQLTGNTVYVDGVFGDDATAMLFHQEKKYKTIGAAMQAIIDYRALPLPLDKVTIIVTPGDYTETVPFNQYGVTIHCHGFTGSQYFACAKIINNGSLDNLEGTDFSGAIALYSTGRDITFTTSTINISAIEIDAPNSVQFFDTYMCANTIQITSPVVNLPNYIHCITLIVVSASITANAGNTIIAADCLLNNGASIAAILGLSITAQNFYTNEASISDCNISSNTFTSNDITVVASKFNCITFTTYQVFINTSSYMYLTANLIVFNAQAVAQTALAGGLVYISAKNIEVNGMYRMMAIKGGSVIVENTVTLNNQGGVYDSPILMQGNGLVSDFIYKSFKTVLTSNGDGHLVSDIDTQFGTQIQVVFDTIFKNTGSTTMGFSISDVTTANTKKQVTIKGKWALTGLPTSFIYVQQISNVVIDAEIVVYSGAATDVVRISGSNNCIVKNEIHDSSTSGVTVNIDSDCLRTIVDAKIVKTNAGYSVGNSLDPINTTNVVFLSNACSNIDKAVANVTYGDIVSTTSPEYDLVVNANIV